MTTSRTPGAGEVQLFGTRDEAERAAVQWVSTTQREPWNQRTPLKLETAEALWGKGEPPNIIVNRENGVQTVEGFGACFNELGWTSLSLLAEDERDGILRELFEPGVGANLTICRMPLGATSRGIGIPTTRRRMISTSRTSASKTISRRSCHSSGQPRLISRT